MQKPKKRLAESIADRILHMITEERRFSAGDKLPNENDLSQELGVSRATLREAVRILSTGGILEIRRGCGTYVLDQTSSADYGALQRAAQATANIRDLFEMRLIFEPESAYFAAKRATDEELSEILRYGEAVEAKILSGEDRTQEEQRFHESIAKATHNEFMTHLLPIIFEAIRSGVILLQKNQALSQKNMSDDRMIMEFLKQRNAEGARTAMKLHILHALQELKLTQE
jgi:GntR family transcriptional repressor for pyruvate dehydrogenase complex